MTAAPAATNSTQTKDSKLSAIGRRQRPHLTSFDHEHSKQPTHKNTKTKPIMSADALFGQGIFEDLQRKIDEDTAVKDVRGDSPKSTPMAVSHERQNVLTSEIADHP